MQKINSRMIYLDAHSVKECVYTAFQYFTIYTNNAIYVQSGFVKYMPHLNP